MAKREKIGILLFDGEAWAGGYYYILNAIKALKTLPNKAKPFLYIFYFSQSSLKAVKEIDYEYLHTLPIYNKCTLFERAINKLLRPILHKNLFTPQPYPKNKVKCIFPYNYLSDYYGLKKLNKIYWIPDFQHLYYPDFFPKSELQKRNECILNISKKNNKIILSSQSAYNDYKKFYPSYQNKVFVVPFVSILPNLSGINWEGITAKHSIPPVYFFSPNQFWKHKNHILVLKALNILKQKKVNVCVLFSGRANTATDKEHIHTLKSYISKYDLRTNVRFLGFIDRKEQLLIMKHALAVIQPSLFEGWSTVIEDAKALNQFVIASNLDVHKEQLKVNYAFFERNNEQALAMILENCVTNVPQKVPLEYHSHINLFARQLTDIWQ